MAIAGRVGAVWISDINVAPTAFTTQATTADGARLRYQVTNGAFRYWPLDATITVFRNAVPVTTGFTLERAGGFVVFDVAQGGGDTITVSGSALTVITAGGMFNWSVEPEAESADATTFASNGWKEFRQTDRAWSGSAEAFWGGDQLFKSWGNIIVVRLFVDAGASQRCYEGFALITTDSVESPVDGLIEESIDFEGIGPLYFRNL